MLSLRAIRDTLRPPYVLPTSLCARKQLQNAFYGNNCNDAGEMDGRPLDQVNGCLLSGVFSRFPVANGAVIGPEEVIFNGYDGNPMKYCAQFSTHSITNVLVGPDNYLYVAMGDGAAFTLPDFGQLGNHVCNDPEGFGGSMRSQDPNRLNGKILRYNPATLEYTAVAMGIRNPFRLGVFGDKLVFTETGWYTVEEVNMVPELLPGVTYNFGWPCWEGNNVQTDFQYLQFPACNQLYAAANDVKPLYFYLHPPNAVGNIASISAVAGYNGRIYYGDYTQVRSQHMYRRANPHGSSLAQPLHDCGCSTHKTQRERVQLLVAQLLISRGIQCTRSHACGRPLAGTHQLGCARRV